MGADELIEIEAIKQLKARYFRWLDEKRWSNWADVFTEDAVLDTTDDGSEILSGREKIVAFVRAAVGDAVTVHHGHMPEIDITGTSSAEGVWSMEDRLEYPNGFTLVGRGHYHEQYEKGADGAWRIRRLRLTRLIVHRAKGRDA